MSIHGTVEINGRIIWLWTARRTDGRGRELETEREYDWEAVYVEVDATGSVPPPRPTAVKGTLRHVPADHGALGLAGRIISEALLQLTDEREDSNA